MPPPADVVKCAQSLVRYQTEYPACRVSFQSSQGFHFQAGGDDRQDIGTEGKEHLAAMVHHFTGGGVKKIARVGIGVLAFR